MHLPRLSLLPNLNHIVFDLKRKNYYYIKIIFYVFYSQMMMMIMKTLVGPGPKEVKPVPVHQSHRLPRLVPVSSLTVSCIPKKKKSVPLIILPWN